MRIDPNSRVGAPATRRSARVGARPNGVFAQALDLDTPPPADAVTATGTVEGLLAFQEVEDPTSGLRRRAWRRGLELLDRLDELKLGIVNGSFSSQRLADLAQLARSGRLATQDPGLEQVLGEIELRAAVEIAKLQRDL